MPEKYENENLRDFLEVLDNIKMSDPKEIVLPKTKQEPKGFFSRIFGNKKLCTEDEKEIIYENIHIDGYTSIIEIIKKLQFLIDCVCKKSWEITNKYEKYTKSVYKLIPFIREMPYETTKFCVGYFGWLNEEYYVEKKYMYAERELELEIDKFPRLIKGNQGWYELFWEDLFTLFSYLKAYVAILSELRASGLRIVQKNGIESDIPVRIHIDNENDIFRNESPIIRIEISNFAMVEYLLREK